MTSRRRLPLAHILMTATLLSACASQGPGLPGRIAFPDGASPETTPQEPATVADNDEAALEDLSDTDLFAPTRDALARHDWIAARLALPVIRGPESTSGSRASTEAASRTDGAQRATALWIRYYEARIALLRGDLDRYATGLAALDQVTLPHRLQRELLRHRESQAALRGDSYQHLLLATELAMELGKTGDVTASESATLKARQWTAAQSLNDAQADSLRRLRRPDLNGWLDLANAARIANPQATAEALDLWLRDYPEHVAADIASTLKNAALADAATTHLTLMVPLSGPLQSAGDAVAQGFMAAFYANPSAGLELSVLDSRRYETARDAYTAARATGADVVVGPLGKLSVQALFESGTLETPLLALNRAEDLQRTDPALELSLAPEDEALQLANWAWSDGARRVLLIRPDSEWGRRMDATLRPRFTDLGGTVAMTAEYRNASGYSDAIRDALGLGASARRGSELRRLFEERVETEGRRRDDLDAVFLLCKNSEEARALRPLINYHFAGDLPVYAISTADTGRDDTNLNRDLNGLQLLALPWRTEPRPVPGFDAPAAQNSLGALHALGVDAFALARRWQRMHSSPEILFPGHTADIMTGNGTLQRRLVKAEFDRGRLRPR